jgi:hypothetical protein
MNYIALFIFPGKDLQGQGIQQLALDRPLQRPSAEVGVITGLGQVISGRLGYFVTVAFFKQHAVHPVQLDGRDASQRLLAKRMEKHDLVDAVQKLGTEVCLQLLHFLREHPQIVSEIYQEVNLSQGTVSRPHRPSERRGRDFPATATQRCTRSRIEKLSKSATWCVEF